MDVQGMQGMMPMGLVSHASSLTESNAALEQLKALLYMAQSPHSRACHADQAESAALKSTCDAQLLRRHKSCRMRCRRD